MKNIFIKKKGEDYSASLNENSLTLLAGNGNMEIMLQTIKKGVTMWISPSDDPELMEFFYIIQGALVLEYDGITETLSTDDCFYVSALTHDIILKSDTELKILYVTSGPLYHNLDNFYCDLDDLLLQIDEKDKCTKEHSERVLKYTMMICEKLHYTGKTLDNLLMAAMFHDVGKCFVPDDILKKHSELDANEFHIIMKHPMYSARLLKGRFNQEVADMAKYHHERLDGSGYPYELSGGDIPFGSRIIAVADSFDAMTSERSYNIAKPYSAAAEELYQLEEKYDRTVTAALREIVMQDNEFKRMEGRGDDVT